MICSACQANVRDTAQHCTACGAKINQPSAATGPLPQAKVAKLRRRWVKSWWSFMLGVLSTGLILPLVGIIALWIFGGTNEARTPSPVPDERPDISVDIDHSYIEQAIATNPDFRNPQVVLGNHPKGGVAMTVTLGYPLPLVGVQAIQARTQIAAIDGKLVVTTENVGLGENGRLSIPGSVIENMLSSTLNEEIDKRLRSNPQLEIAIINTSTSNQVLRVSAIITTKPK